MAAVGRGRAREEVASPGNAGVRMAGGGRRAAISAASAGPGRPGRPQGRRQQQLQEKQRSVPWPKPRRWVSLPLSFYLDLSPGRPCPCGEHAGGSAVSGGVRESLE